MPYAGVPAGSEEERKIESCVKQVMAKNPRLKKSNAIAICRASIKKEEAGEMPKTKNGITARQRRKMQKQGSPTDELVVDEKAYEEEAMDEIFPDDFEDFMEEQEVFSEEELEELDELMDEPEITTLEEVDELDDEKEHFPGAKELVEDIVSVPAEQEKETEEEEQFDYDVAMIEMLIRMDARPVSEKVGDMLKKAVLSGNARSKLSDSDFALVVTRDGKKHRKYPIHDKAHVRNALARAAQMIKSGGQAAADARSALPKIRAAAKKFGIGQPSDKCTNGVLVEKDATGDWRFVGWLSGKWKDRDGEIISDAAHKEFVDFLEENPDYQIAFRSWHTPGTDRTNPIDYWVYENGFVIVSGKLEEDEAQRLMKAAAKTHIGMSHGCFAAKDKNVITKYRTYEVSDLPLDNAAFPWSDLTVLAKEIKTMKTKLDYFADVLDPDTLRKLVEDTETKKVFLETLNVEEKDLDAFLETEPKPEEKAADEVPEDVKETDEVVVEEIEVSPEIVDRLRAALGMEDFEQVKESLESLPVMTGLLKATAKRVVDLEKRLDDAKKDSDDILADWISNAQSNKLSVHEKRASQSDKTEIDDDDELRKSVPTHESSWLTDLVGTEPVK